VNAGGVGQIGVYVDAVRNSTFSNFGILGPNIGFATMGVSLNIDDDAHTGTFITTNDHYTDLIVDEAGAGIDIANLSSINTDLQFFQNVQMLRRGQYFAYLGPGTNAVANQFDHCSDNGTQYGFFLNHGQVSAITNFTFNSNIAFWGASSRATTMAYSSCEHCVRAIVRTGATGNVMTLFNDSFIPLQVSTDGFGIVTEGALVAVINSDFSLGNTGNWNVFGTGVYGGAGSPGVTIHSSIFPNNTPFTSIGKGGGISIVGNLSLTAGSLVPIPDLNTNPLVLQSSNAANTPLTITSGGAAAPTVDLFDTSINNGVPLTFIDKGGHLASGATAIPTLTAGCNGAGSSISATSGDGLAFEVTTQTAASTTCTVTFNRAFAHSPTCICSDHNASITPLGCSVGAEGTGTVVLDYASGSNLVWNVICIGH
jgi:hypothetical protein